MEKFLGQIANWAVPAGLFFTIGVFVVQHAPKINLDYLYIPAIIAGAIWFGGKYYGK